MSERALPRRTTGEVRVEAGVVVTEDTQKVSIRWHGAEPRRLRISIGGHQVAHVAVVLQPGEEVVLTSEPASDFERALARIAVGDVRVIEDDPEPG